MNCQHCNSEFDGHKRRFCTARCRVLARLQSQKVAKSCEACGNVFSTHNDARFCSATCSNAGRRKVARKCAVCSELFIPGKGGNAGLCCGRACGLKYAQSVRLKRYEVIRARKSEPNGQYAPLPLKRCNCCRAPFVARRGRKFCSAACLYSANSLTVKSIVTSTCKECGVEFDRVANPLRPPKYCSKQCAARPHKRTRRAKEKTNREVHDTVNFAEVYFKENGRCHVCGLVAPKHLKGSRLFAAPSIDHVVPLSRDGDHGLHNVKIAHRLCNVLKSNGTAWDAGVIRGRLNAKLFEYYRLDQGWRAGPIPLA